MYANKMLVLHLLARVQIFASSEVGFRFWYSFYNREPRLSMFSVFISLILVYTIKTQFLEIRGFISVCLSGQYSH